MRKYFVAFTCDVCGKETNDENEVVAWMTAHIQVMTNDKSHTISKDVCTKVDASHKTVRLFLSDTRPYKIFYK